MSSMFSFSSKEDHLTVIDLALDMFLKKQRRQDKQLSFDENLLLNTSRIELLKENLSSMQKEHPDGLIGINMEFFHSCEDSKAFLHFTEDLPNPSKIFFYNILPNSDFQTRMLSDMAEMQAEFDGKVHTGDSFLDVILNYYRYLATKEAIEFSVSGKLTEEVPLEMFDMTTLMGNILQNAVEAAAKASAPRIRIELIEHKKEVFIVVTNSTAEKIKIGKDFFMTSKSDKVNHGFGLKNVIAVVEKYHGEYYMESVTENGEALFQVSIGVPKAENRKRL